MLALIPLFLVMLSALGWYGMRQVANRRLKLKPSLRCETGGLVPRGMVIVRDMVVPRDMVVACDMEVSHDG